MGRTINIAIGPYFLLPTLQPSMSHFSHTFAAFALHVSLAAVIVDAHIRLMNGFSFSEIPMGEKSRKMK